MSDLHDMSWSELIELAKTHRALLKVARCPNTQCTDGAIPHGPNPDGSWEAEQCQWCYEREDALGEKE